ncbi:MAG TPA: hypothetical protein VGU26_01840 [Gaiellaceae bacterium]|nr:hypothetical protein [Gaiellaceae bacterium]
MHRLGTGLVVAALLGVAVAAAVDALPEGKELVADTRPPQKLVDALTEAGVRGTLTYSDQACRLHAVRLPSLQAARAPTIRSCEPHVPTGGIGAWKGGVVWSGLGYQTVQVVLSQEEIEQSLRERFGLSSGRFRAMQAVSLAGGRYAVTVESVGSPRWSLLAFFDEGRLDLVHPGGALRPSPQGRYVAVIEPARDGVTVYTSAGGITPLPDLGGAHSIAWSPDERWTALATGASVFVFPTKRPEPPIIRIPIRVRDLDWSA